MKNVFREALDHYFKGSNTQLVFTFGLVALIAAVLTFLYVFFLGRHHADNFLLAYLMPLLLLTAGIAFVIAARSVSDPWNAIVFAILALFFIFGAAVSFLVTLLLFILVY